MSQLSTVGLKWSESNERLTYQLQNNDRGDKIVKAINMHSTKEREKSNQSFFFMVECVPTSLPPHKIPAFNSFAVQFQKL